MREEKHQKLSKVTFSSLIAKGVNNKDREVTQNSFEAGSTFLRHLRNYLQIKLTTNLDSCDSKNRLVEPNYEEARTWHRGYRQCLREMIALTEEKK